MKILTKLLIGILAIIVILVVFVGIQYLWKGRPLNTPAEVKPEIVAHRGVHLNYRKGVYDRGTGCEAQYIFPPTHAFIENTLESINAAFNYGATIVEIDIRKTADSNLVIFHDFGLDCRTDGGGLIKDHHVDYLKTLDVGYGYTTDNGLSYPLRGKGIGLMLTLDEVLSAFPDQYFIIDHKDGDEESTQILMNILAAYPLEQREKLLYWGPPETLDLLNTQYPEIKRFFMLRWQVKKYFLPYFLSFGMKPIPPEYHGLVMAIPVEYLKYVWGWPYRFIKKTHNAGVKIYLFVDTAEDAEKYRSLPVDGFVTDYIEIVGPVLKQH